MRSGERHPADRPRVAGYLLGTIFAIAVVLMWMISIRREMWLDEYHSWFLSQLPWPDLEQFIEGDVHPPLYFWTLKLWSALTGDSPSSLRSLSVVCQAGAILVFAAMAVRLFENRTTALWTSAWFAVSPALIYYGAEARMYAMAIFWVTLAMLGWALRSRPSQSDGTRLGGWGLLVVGCSAAYLTHYSGAFFVVGLGIAWSIDSLRRRERPLSLAAWAVAVLAVVNWWFPVMFAQQRMKAQVEQARLAALDLPAQQGGIDLANVAGNLMTNLASLAGVFPLNLSIWSWLIALPFALALIFGAYAALKDSRAASLSLPILATVALGAILVLGGASERRYLLLGAPALLLLMGAGLAHLRRHAASTVAPLVAVSIFAISLAGSIRLATGDYPPVIERAAATLARLSSPDDLVIFSSPYGQIPIEYHARRLGVRREMTGFPRSIHDWWQAQPFKGWGTEPPSPSQLEAFLDALPADTVWLLDYESYYQDPYGALLDGLRERRNVVEIDLGSSNPYRLYRAAPTQ